MKGLIGLMSKYLKNKKRFYTVTSRKIRVFMTFDDEKLKEFFLLKMAIFYGLVEGVELFEGDADVTFFGILS